MTIAAAGPPANLFERPGIVAEVMVESPLWRRLPQAEATIRTAIAAAARNERVAAGELAIVLCDDAMIRGLNRDWRGIDKPTDVLSFPSHDPKSGLGDIIIAFETLAADAAAQKKPFDRHLAHIVVHGFLHLLGYDHEEDRAADEMERREVDILAQLAIADPYARCEIDD